MTKKKPRPGASSARSPLPSARPEAGRIHRNPLDYDHPFPSMAEFAALLNLRHAYYRDLRGPPSPH
jgi:hypothetical protein